MDYSIQLYSVRDVWPHDYKGTLEKLARMGYKQVELYGGMAGPGAENLKKWMDALGLTMSGTHTGADALLPENLQQTIRDHQTVGCKYLIIPGHDLSTKAKLDAFIELVNKTQPLLEKEGITLGYHNHSHEFLPNEDGQIIYDELRARTQLALELDIYWAYNAGQDVPALLDALRPRLIAIHLKDGVMGGEGFPLGRGTAPVKESREKAIAFGLPIVVESETCKPSGLAEARECIDFLHSLEG